jgi:hypothetical protein
VQDRFIRQRDKQEEPRQLQKGNMAKDISKVLFKIEDEATWDQVMEISDTKLVVIDIHQEWCGCCEAIHPSMSRVLIDYDEIEARFLYCTASIAKVGAKLQAALPSDCHINLEKNGCLPLFGVFKVRNCFELHSNRSLTFHFNSFLIPLQGKTCLSVVVGLDSPTLLLQIAQNMPEKPVKE